MVDFYEELNLNQTDSIEDINRTLNQLENIWKRREINNPEKATRMLATILDAREAFKSEATKAKYDYNLAESRADPKQIDYDEERRVQFKKYRLQAEEYFINENQADLAFEAMKRAILYRDPNHSDGSFSYLCSMIRHSVGDINGALSDITEAIVTEPDNAVYYQWKAAVLGDLFNAAMSNQSDLQIIRSYLAQNRLNYEKGLELAQQSGNKEIQIECLEGLAESYSNMYDSDYTRALNYANQARALGDTNPELQQIIDYVQNEKSDFKPYQGSEHPTTSSGGCYIATSVYGSYDCPEVWVLRRYRDDFLSTSFHGRLFILIYYMVSPKVVRVFGKRKWFNRIIRKRLNRFVSNLKLQGYSDDPYYDRM